MEFFQLHKEYNTIYEYSEDTDPINYQGTYGNFVPLLGKLFYQKPLGTDDEKQILLMKNERGLFFILKRYIHQCSSTEKDLFNTQDSELIKFFNHSFKEFELSKIIWAHPNSVAAYELKFTKLSKTNQISSEFLMEYGGQNLYKLLKDVILDGGIIIKILKQTSSVFSFIEMYKILYNDVKLENFVIDLKTKIVRLIDFDVSQGTTSHHSTSGKRKTISGFTQGYVAPEIVTRLYDSMKGIDSVYNPWKADVYSWGILVLVLLRGVTPTSLCNNSFDKWKTFEEDHDKEISLLIKNINFPNDNEMTNKMKTILKYCLAFKPENRVTFFTLNTILNEINSHSVFSIEGFLSKALKESLNPAKPIIPALPIQPSTLPSPKKDDSNLLKKTIDQQAVQIQKLQGENQRLRDELNHISSQNQSLSKQVETLSEKNQQYVITINDNENMINQLLDGNSNVPSGSKISNNAKQTEAELIQLKKDFNELKEKDQKIINELRNKVNYLENQLKKVNNEIKEPEEKLEKIFHESLEALEKHKSNIQLQQVEDIPQVLNLLLSKMTLLRLLEVLATDTIKGHCVICGNDQNYSEMIKCISESKFISNGTKKILNSNKSTWSFLNANITKNDAKAIVALLKVNESISCIDLSFNSSVDDDIGEAFEKAIKEHPSLKEFYIHQTKISSKKQVAIALIAKSIKNLRQFCLDYDAVSIEEAAVVSVLLNYEMKIGSYNDKGEFLDSKALAIKDNALIYGIKECVLFKNTK